MYQVLDLVTANPNRNAVVHRAESGGHVHGHGPSHLASCRSAMGDSKLVMKLAKM